MLSLACHMTFDPIYMYETIFIVHVVKVMQSLHMGRESRSLEQCLYVHVYTTYARVCAYTYVYTPAYTLFTHLAHGMYTAVQECKQTCHNS